MRIDAPPTFPALEQYLTHLRANPQADTRVWLDAAGRAQGQYFNSTLTSAFQPIRRIGAEDVLGFEGFARSYSETDGGLSLWTLLDHAASDDESIELDRLCRMLHAINFFRQPVAATQDLYLSVHARLLAAVDGDHGRAFSHVLKVLGLPQQQVVLQLPVVTEYQTWLVNYVADNYRRNGFRIAVNAIDAEDAQALMQRVRPEIVKLDYPGPAEVDSVVRLLRASHGQGTKVVFKRVEHAAEYQSLQAAVLASGVAAYAQGIHLGRTNVSVAEVRVQEEDQAALTNEHHFETELLNPL